MSIGPAFAGLSYEKNSLYENPNYLFQASNANLIALFQLLGPSILRLGGSSVDHNVWVGPGGYGYVSASENLNTGQTPGAIATRDVDNLFEFVAKTGWKCLYGINLGCAGPIPATNGIGPNFTPPPATTSEYAAAEIAYVVDYYSDLLFGFEIGNEPNLYGSSFWYGNTWNFDTFESPTTPIGIWDTFYNAIVEQTPAAIPFCTGPATADGEEDNWTVTFGQNVTKSKIFLLTDHYYRKLAFAGEVDGDPASANAANLVTPDSTLTGTVLPELYAGCYTGYNSKPPIGVPFRISECNSYPHAEASSASNCYASTLWVIDFLFNLAQGGSTGANFHGGSDLIYAPIQDSGGAVTSVQPEYYGILLFTLAGQGPLYTISQISGYNVTAYAVFSSPGLNVVVVNKDSANSFDITIDLPSNMIAVSAVYITVTQSSDGGGPSLTATDGVTIQGATISNSCEFVIDGTSYPNLPTGTPLSVNTESNSTDTCVVQPLSAVLIQITLAPPSGLVE